MLQFEGGIIQDVFRASPEATFKCLLFSESLLNKVMVKQAEQEFLLHSLHILREDAINTPINHIDKCTYIYELGNLNRKNDILFLMRSHRSLQRTGNR